MRVRVTRPAFPILNLKTNLAKFRHGVYKVRSNTAATPPICICHTEKLQIKCLPLPISKPYSTVHTDHPLQPSTGTAIHTIPSSYPFGTHPTLISIQGSHRSITANNPADLYPDHIRLPNEKHPKLQHWHLAFNHANVDTIRISYTPPSPRTNTSRSINITVICQDYVP